MKSKIILFDIDGTLFDASSFLNVFYRILTSIFSLSKEDIDRVQIIYDQNKKENGYFHPSSFQSKITDKFPEVQGDKLQEILWNIDLFKQNVYKDTSVIESLSKVAKIGIFSKGDRDFQKKKLISLKDYIADEDIFIFPEKINKISEILYKYKDFQVFMVDNEIEVLIKVKNLFPKIETILIDRKNIYQEANKILKIKTLEGLKLIIYD